MAHKKRVILGLVGTVLDAGLGPARWEKWRPTVSLCQEEDFLVDRIELLHQRQATKLTDLLAADIKTVSPETEVRKTQIEFNDAWDFEAVYGALHEFARHYPFDTDAEKYFVHITTGTHVAQICLFLLTEARYFPGQLIQSAPPRRGAESAGELSIIDLDLSRYDKIATRFQHEIQEGLSFLKSGIATRNKDFNRLIENIERVAIRSKAPVLLMGQTGAGKSRLARRIFDLKKTRHQLPGNFIEVNCATIRGDAAMSTLFGHVKGSFTGASQDRKGLLVAADGGLLFLDEIGELGPDEQAMLLRALEEKRFSPLGSDKEAQSDFQLIAGTNCDLAAAIRTGHFREDLLARINLWTFRLPPLRERPEDIEPNLDYELDEHARKSGSKVSFNKEARDEFLTFAISIEAAWKANFRDLNAAVNRMATMSDGGRISVGCVQEEIQRLRSAWHDPLPTTSSDGLDGLLGAERLAELDLFDRVQLAEVVKVCRQSPSLAEAGRILFSASREKKKTTNDSDRLRKYLAAFGLRWADIA
jgi:transcriptional regulatory protein RtcR